MSQFIAGGGLGDCLTVLNKYQQIVNADCPEELTYYTTSAQAKWVPAMEEFWYSQCVPARVEAVDDLFSAIRLSKKRHRLLNNLAWGAGPWHLGGTKVIWCPFDAVAISRMVLHYAQPAWRDPYMVIQTDSGTMRYHANKHWSSTDWITDLCTQIHGMGFKPIMIGTKLDFQANAMALLNLPLLDLFGVLKHASCVIGLHGFITMAARYMGVPTLVKHESIQSSLWYSPLGWLEWSHEFREKIATDKLKKLIGMYARSPALGN